MMLDGGGLHGHFAAAQPFVIVLQGGGFLANLGFDRVVEWKVARGYFQRSLHEFLQPFEEAGRVPLCGAGKLGLYRDAASQCGPKSSTPLSSLTACVDAQAHMHYSGLVRIVYLEAAVGEDLQLWWLLPRTSAAKRVIPFLCAIVAKCLSSSVPIP